MEVLVCPTSKSKHFHACVDYLGLETDVKLNWVRMKFSRNEQSL